jgi:hypothetical protein
VYIDLFSTLDEALSESLQMDCNKHDVGITIIAVRVTKVPGPSFQSLGVCQLPSRSDLPMSSSLLAFSTAQDP